VTIEIDGKKVALGVPGAPRSTNANPEPEAYQHIPLRRGGTTDDSAGSILLYVSPCCIIFDSIIY
jgi:3-oxoacyl-[acyl-carrier protein] reductase